MFNPLQKNRYTTHLNALLIQLLIMIASLLLSDHTANAQENRPSEWATPIAKGNNLYRVNQNFYRSAQIETKDIALIEALGIKTVISLRTFHDDTRLLKNSGIKVQRIGINTWEISDTNIIAALRAIKLAEHDGPVLLHCMHGADRTGLVTAMYRILYQGWSKEKALEELTKGGFGYHSLWKTFQSI